MNSFGVNGAAVNGGRSIVIAGAALMAATFAASAEPTVTKFPTALAAATSAASATAVRIVNAAATCTVTSTSSAQWALLELADATARSTWSTRATPTEAYAPSVFSCAVTATQTQPGTGIAASTYAVTADAQVVQGFKATSAGVSSMTADPSIKLAGQTVWQREGYALGVMKSSASASPVRTALPTAVATTTSSMAAEATKIHAGAAVCTISFQGTALAAVDSAVSRATYLVTADALRIASGDGAASSTYNVSATCTNTTPAMVEPVNTTFNTVAAARLAILGEAIATSTSSASADARLGFLATTMSSQAKATCRATAMVYQEGIALPAAFTWSASARGTIIHMASARMEASSTATATPTTNAEAFDPPERTMWRPRTNRAMARPHTNREMRRTP